MLALKCDKCGKIKSYSPESGTRTMDHIELCKCGGVRRVAEVQEAEVERGGVAPEFILKGDGWTEKFHKKGE